MTTDTPAARVRAFIDARAQMDGPIDHDTVYSVWVAGEKYDLLTADLAALVEAVGA